jgi:hypothetical protein
MCKFQLEGVRVGAEVGVGRPGTGVLTGGEQLLLDTGRGLLVVRRDT